MKIVTGAAGFIGSCLLHYLAESTNEKLVAVDDFSKSDKQRNYINKESLIYCDRMQLFDFIAQNGAKLSCIYHLGARTDTVDQDPLIFEELNFSYSKELWKWAVKFQIPFIYASSAATYGDGKLGFDDKMSNLSELVPMNEYGRSKHRFDQWALKQVEKPPKWFGLKFFNVYGPNEYHKGRMASVIFHAFHQIRKTGKMKLFRSHKSEYQDGMQKRDFIYVQDVCSVLMELEEKDIRPGIYNLGTGKARTFNDLVFAVFAAMGRRVEIEYIDIPEDIRENYQYFTEADMSKLKSEGINCHFYALEKGIKDYVQKYLLKGEYL